MSYRAENEAERLGPLIRQAKQDIAERLGTSLDGKWTRVCEQSDVHDGIGPCCTLRSEIETEAVETAERTLVERGDRIASIVSDKLWGGECGWETATNQQFNGLCDLLRQRLGAADKIKPLLSALEKAEHLLAQKPLTPVYVAHAHGIIADAIESARGAA